MYRNFSPAFKQQSILVFIDLLIFTLIAIASSTLFGETSQRYFNTIWMISSIIFLYVSGRYSRVDINIGLTSVIRTVACLALSILVSYPFMSGDDTSRAIFILFLFSLSVTLILALSKLYSHISSQLNPKIYFLTKNRDKYEDKLRVMESGLLQLVQKITTIESLAQIDENDSRYTLIVDEELLKDKKISSIVFEKRVRGISVINFWEAYADTSGRIPLDLIDFPWLLKHEAMSYYQTIVVLKAMRVIEAGLAIILIFLFAVPVVLISIAIKFDSKGPIFFKQERLGKNKKPFMLYKFRSMRVDAEQNGPQWATVKDSRVTRLGEFLRKSHLDELPQILNLVKGDLGLVGPRPIRAYFAQKLSESIPYYNLRFLVKPGITGWAQVKGPYGANLEEQRIKFEMEVYFIMRYSFSMYIHILIDTIKLLFSRTKDNDLENANIVVGG